MLKKASDTRASLGKSRVIATLGRVGRWTLVVIVLCLALIGFLHLTRGTAVRHVRGVAADGAPISVSEPEFPLMATMATGAWLAPGNRVEVMLNGDGTYPRLWEDLRSAQRSITLQLYYGAPGRMADTLSEILRERAKAGVRVFVLYDAFGTVDIPANHRDELRAAGIVVEPFRPIRLSTLHLAQNRSHVRGIVIDSRVGWTGGFGIDDKWFGDGHSNGSWRETNVRFEGPAVRQLQAAFAAAWVEATGVMFTGRATLESEPNGATRGPPVHGTNAGKHGRRALLRAVYRRRAEDLVHHELVLRARPQLHRPARGGRTTWGRRTDPDGRAAHRCQRRPTRRPSVVRHAARGGRPVYEWQPTTLHAKTFVVDGAVVHRGVDELRQSFHGAQR